MAKQIAKLTPGTIVTLRFCESTPFEEDAEFLGISPDGQSAYFRTQESPGDIYDWDAYRDRGRWVYGSSADRLQLVATH